MSRWCRFLFPFRITPRVRSPFARAGYEQVSRGSLLVGHRLDRPGRIFVFWFASLFRILIATTFPTSAIFLAACIKVDLTIALWSKETRKARGNQTRPVFGAVFWNRGSDLQAIRNFIPPHSRFRANRRHANRLYASLIRKARAYTRFGV